jgi:hypothetical protein
MHRAEGLAGAAARFYSHLHVCDRRRFRVMGAGEAEPECSECPEVSDFS